MQQRTQAGLEPSHCGKDFSLDTWGTHCTRWANGAKPVVHYCSYTNTKLINYSVTFLNTAHNFVPFNLQKHQTCWPMRKLQYFIKTTDLIGHLVSPTVYLYAGCCMHVCTLCECVYHFILNSQHMFSHNQIYTSTLHVYTTLEALNFLSQYLLLPLRSYFQKALKTSRQLCSDHTVFFYTFHTNDVCLSHFPLLQMSI